MKLAERVTFTRIVDEICALNWPGLTSDEGVDVAWAYYHFSIQFRESLDLALELYPTDQNLRVLAREECDTANLSPWPGVAAAGERMNHDSFMQRSLDLEPIDSLRRLRLEAAGQDYLAATRGLDPAARAMSIASYEDGGLERVFHAMLASPHWDTQVLAAFRHFLVEHIRFDSDPSEGHGALARHMQLDDRVLPLWSEFKTLLLACVPGLSHPANG